MLSGYPVPFSDDELEREEGAHRAWFPEDDEAAEWAMAKLAEAVHEERIIAERAEAYRQRATEWEESLRRRPASKRKYFTSILERYGLVKREATDGKVKTVELLSGTISTRGSEGERIVVDDPAALLEWANTRGKGIRDALTESKLKPVTELRKQFVVYTKTACRDCGNIEWALTPMGCGSCGGMVRVVERAVGISTFGLDEDAIGQGFHLVPGVSLEAAPPATASISLAGERALPKGS